MVSIKKLKVGNYLHIINFIGKRIPYKDLEHLGIRRCNKVVYFK